MEGLDGRLVELQERFAAGADDERARPLVVRTVPCGSYRRASLLAVVEPSAARAVVPTKSVSQNWQIAASAIFLRGRSTGCNW